MKLLILALTCIPIVLFGQDSVHGTPTATPVPKDSVRYSDGTKTYWEIPDATNTFKGLPDYTKTTLTLDPGGDAVALWNSKDATIAWANYLKIHPRIKEPEKPSDVQIELVTKDGKVWVARWEPKQ